MRTKNNPTREQVAGQLRKINYTKRVLPDVREFLITSTTNTETYYVMRIKSTTWECTCPDFRFRRKECKHIKRYSC